MFRLFTAEKLLMLALVSACSKSGGGESEAHKQSFDMTTGLEYSAYFGGTDAYGSQVLARAFNHLESDKLNEDLGLKIQGQKQKDCLINYYESLREGFASDEVKKTMTQMSERYGVPFVRFEYEGHARPGVAEVTNLMALQDSLMIFNDPTSPKFHYYMPELSLSFRASLDPAAIKSCKIPGEATADWIAKQLKFYVQLHHSVQESYLKTIIGKSFYLSDGLSLEIIRRGSTNLYHLSSKKNQLLFKVSAVNGEELSGEIQIPNFKKEDLDFTGNLDPAIKALAEKQVDKLNAEVAGSHRDFKVQGAWLADEI